jgi:hypothetical protein
MSHLVQILMPLFLETSAAKNGGVYLKLSFGVGESVLGDSTVKLRDVGWSALH